MTVFLNKLHAYYITVARLHTVKFTVAGIEQMLQSPVCDHQLETGNKVDKNIEISKKEASPKQQKLTKN